MERKIKVGGVYKHFKGNLYEVVAVAYDSESNNDDEPHKLVVYKAVYGDGKVWFRDYDMFLSKVDKNKYPDVNQEYRFEEVE